MHNNNDSGARTDKKEKFALMDAQRAALRHRIAICSAEVEKVKSSLQVQIDNEPIIRAYETDRRLLQYWKLERRAAKHALQASVTLPLFRE